MVPAEAVHWEVDFGYFDEYPDVLPDKELGLAYEECAFNVIWDDHYKYVHFAAMPPLFFDLKNNLDERYNLANDSNFTGLMLEYARKILSWGITNDERTLTGLRVGPKGFIKIIRNQNPHWQSARLILSDLSYPTYLVLTK